MSDKLDLIAKLSGQTKAFIIVNEYRIGNLGIQELNDIYGILAASDLEKIGMLELVKKECDKSGLSEDDKNALIGGLTSGGDIDDISSSSKKERKTITVKPFNALDKDSSNKPPAPPPLYPGQGQKTSKEKLSASAHERSESTQTQRVVKSNDHAYFGESAGRVGHNFQNFSTPRILIADDDPRIRMIFRMKIQAAGYEIIEAENGDMAWELLNEKKPDGLVMDMKMPGLHGLEILAKMIQKPDKIPVCICSAYDQLKDEYVIKNYPTLKYFVKPVDAQELVKAVCEMVPIEK